MLELIDVSGSNVTHDVRGAIVPLPWSDIAKALSPETSAVIVKATEGVDFIDPAFWSNVMGARDVGYFVLTYHYLRVRHGVAQDASKQLAQYGALVASADLPPRLIVDCECAENTPPAVAQEWGDAIRFARLRAKADTSLEPCLYTSPGEWRSMGGVVLSTAVDFAASPLWVADVRGNDAPEVPPPFSDWALWQYTWKSVIAGHTFDRSRFRGTLDDLKSWAGAAA